MRNNADSKIANWSICVSVMDRNHTLDKTLPTWTTCELVKEIVILDWSSTERVMDIVNKHQNGNIVVGRVEGQKTFSQAVTKNVKVRLCSQENIFVTDCDVKIMQQDFLTKHPITDNMFYHGEWKDQMNVTGSCLIRRSHFAMVNGYNENLSAYGMEDVDFYERLNSVGIKETILKNSKEYIYHIPHSHVERFKNYGLHKDIACDEGKCINFRQEQIESNKILSKQHTWDHHCSMARFDIRLTSPDGNVKVIEGF